MVNPPEVPVKVPDPVDISIKLTDIALSSERLMEKFLWQQVRRNGDCPAFADDLGIGKAFFEMTARLVSDPFRLAENQINLWHSYVALWQGSFLRLLGAAPAPVITPAKTDRRFRDDAWNEYFVFDFIKQSYLLAARWLQTTVASVDGLDEPTARKVDFYTRQFVDALAPTNFVLTNPEVLRETVQTGGQNLLDGLRNLLEDLDRGKGRLDIRMTDLEAFRLGENIAITPGRVIFQNKLMQLLQYAPATERVRRRPLLIVPPWINKFYILDLRPKNSFIKWAVDQGHTVFVISWVNPDQDYAETTFDDYLTQGTLAALEAIEQAIGESDVNAVGYCLGGTLLGATLGYMAAAGDERIKSAALLTTLLDFERPGELEVFLDAEQVSTLEKRMEHRGFLDGAEMATSFSLLRANDLIWSFVVNNYLLGKDPFPFDLLYWNSDATRMPAAMHSFYLRNMYLENRLRQPGGIELAGRPIDLARVKAPVYFLSTVEDHIAPWKSTYAGTRLFGGPIRFVLGASGHIAGVINPPSADKYGYWTNPELPAQPECWRKGAKPHQGSWWRDWNGWVSGLDDGLVPARVPGEGALKPLEDAPGSYVKRRL